MHQAPDQHLHQQNSQLLHIHEEAACLTLVESLLVHHQRSQRTVAFHWLS